MRAPSKFDEYYLIERIAVGGMAEVFKGVSYGAEGFERLSAVKRVLPHIAEDKEFIEMFIDEAKIAAQLQHPNIGQVFHLGQSEGKYFIAMEFISGQDLRSIFDRARERGTPLDLGWCAYMIKEVCEALDYAHRKTNARQEPLHLIHRDVSPQNIIVSYDGGTKLIDFGIAKANGKINQTQVGILKGKFSYMSPEQARGHQLDQRADLFALAVVLYELVTLERCFLGQSDFSTIERVRGVEFTPPRQIRRDIPAALEKIIQKGLAANANDRYQSAADFQEALTRFMMKGHPCSRSDARAHMERLFSPEIQREKQRLEDFRRYALEHIPEASRSLDARGEVRFDPHLQAPSRDGSRPQFALSDQPRLSMSPANERPRSIQGQRGPSGVYRAPPSARARALLLLMLALLAGGGAASVVWLRGPSVGSLQINAASQAAVSFRLEGGGERREGFAPTRLSALPAGDYTLHLSSPIYQQAQMSVRVAPNTTTNLTPQLTLIQGMGSAQIATTPSGAELWLGGRSIGRSPLTLYAPVGHHAVRATLSGYDVVEQPVHFTQPPQDLGVWLLFPERVRVHLTPSVETAKVYLRDSALAEWRLLGEGAEVFTIRNRGDTVAKIEAEGYVPSEVIFPRYPQDEAHEWVELVPRKGLRPEPSLEPLRVSPPPSPPPSPSPSPRPEPIVEVIDPRPPLKIEARPPQPAPQRQSPRASSRPQPRPRPAPRAASRPTPQPAEPPDAQPGFLRLMAIPPVEVFWRGRSLGWTPLRDYKLPEGTHELTLRLRDGETYKVSQTITAGRSALMKWKRP